MVNSDGDTRGRRVPELDPEGSRGILTEDDREFLASSDKRKELSAPNRSQRWSDIRDRIGNAMMDFLWLVYCLPDEQRRRIFDDDRLSDPDDPRWQERSFSYLVAFMHQQLDDIQRIERAVATGIRRAELQNGEMVDVDVQISSELIDTIKDIRQRFAERGLQSISIGEINALYHAGYLTAAERTTLELEKRSFPAERRDSEKYIQNVQDEVQPDE